MYYHRWFYASNAGPWYGMKMSYYGYRKYHCGDKTVLLSSYLHNEISYIGKTKYLYWITALNALFCSVIQYKDFVLPEEITLLKHALNICFGHSSPLIIKYSGHGLAIAFRRGLWDIRHCVMWSLLWYKSSLLQQWLLNWQMGSNNMRYWCLRAASRRQEPTSLTTPTHRNSNSIKI